MDTKDPKKNVSRSRYTTDWLWEIMGFAIVTPAIASGIASIGHLPLV